jgi:lipoate-protein ligase B
MRPPPIPAYYFKQPLAYAPALATMEKWVTARVENRVGDAIFFLEHTPVITLGMRGRDEHIRLQPDQLQTRGIDRVTTSRGGEVTLHAPGQLVIYPILKLSGAAASAGDHVHRLEELGIRTAGDFGLTAFRRKGLTGIWTERGKLGAIGVRFRRWVSFHGLSLNINLDLKLFDLIVPCGLAHEPVTSFQALLDGKAPSLETVRTRAMEQCEIVFGQPCSPQSLGDTWPPPPGDSVV